MPDFSLSQGKSLRVDSTVAPSMIVLPMSGSVKPICVDFDFDFADFTDFADFDFDFADFDFADFDFAGLAAVAVCGIATKAATMAISAIRCILNSMVGDSVEPSPLRCVKSVA